MNSDPKHFESLYPSDAREKEIAEIVSFVREGNSSQLIGIPGVGRSNVLSLLSYNKGVRLKHFPTTHAYIHFVRIDFSEVRRRPLVDTYKLLFLSLADSLRERNLTGEYAVVNDILRESLSFQDEMVLSQGLKRAVDFLSVEKKFTIIFLFDRFEEYLPSISAEFFTTLRVLRNRAKYRFSVVFSLLRPLEEVVDPVMLSDFHEFLVGHMVFVRVLDVASVEFRIQYLEKMTGKKLGRGVLEQVITLTGGHGRLTRLSVESLLANPVLLERSSRKQNEAIESPKRPYRPTHAGLQGDILKEFLLEQATIRNGLLEIWKGLTPLEQDVLEHKETDTQAEQFLSHVGLLSGTSCTIPLLHDFMEESGRIAQIDKQPITFDEATNTIRRGELVLSDHLTKAEYRLLVYFVTHPEQVVERDELISAVWKEAASTAGVTDQAVDQLIFRVRRKIEDDPNKPEHVQTVKGRGFRFAP